MKITPLYPGGKPKALTFSYDDGVRFDGQLIEIFNRYGMKGTFNLNAGSLASERKFHADELKEVYAGHEIASHGFEHPFLERIPRACALNDMLADRRELEKITGGIYHNVLPPCPNCGSSGDPILSKKTFTFICPGCGIPRGSTGPDVQVVY